MQTFVSLLRLNPLANHATKVDIENKSAVRLYDLTKTILVSRLWSLPLLPAGRHRADLLEHRHRNHYSVVCAAGCDM